MVKTKEWRYIEWDHGDKGIELYDQKNDPIEYNNLADDPAYAETLQRLRDALSAHQQSYRDFGDTDESRMAEEFWPGGEQPLTAAVQFRQRADGLLELHSDSEGASIAYRTEGGSWQLYHTPIKAISLEAKAIRYGWAESDLTEYQP